MPPHLCLLVVAMLFTLPLPQSAPARTPSGDKSPAVSASTLIGRWLLIEVKMGSAPKQPSGGYVELRKDGSYVAEFEIMEPIGAETTGKTAFSGRWTLEGDVLITETEQAERTRSKVTLQGHHLVLTPERSDAMICYHKKATSAR